MIKLSNVLLYYLVYISKRRQSSLRCGGNEHSELNTKCYSGEDWTNVSLEEFIKCDSNLAWNRQTRMLADLTQIGCYQNIFNLTVNELDRFEIILDNNLLAITCI